MTDKQDFEDIETRRENRTRATKTRLYALGAVVGVIAIGGVAATGTVLSSDNSEARDEQRMKAVSTFYSDSCRSEEHTSELQSRFDLVCRLLLQKTIHTTLYDIYRI